MIIIIALLRTQLYMVQILKRKIEVWEKLGHPVEKPTVEELMLYTGQISWT